MKANEIEHYHYWKAKANEYQEVNFEIMKLNS